MIAKYKNTISNTKFCFPFCGALQLFQIIKKYPNQNFSAFVTTKASEQDARERQSLSGQQERSSIESKIEIAL